MFQMMICGVFKRNNDQKLIFEELYLEDFSFKYIFEICCNTLDFVIYREN